MNRTFMLKIKFESIPGTTLEASSDFNQITIEEAIIQAIGRAKNITSQLAKSL